MDTFPTILFSACAVIAIAGALASALAPAAWRGPALLALAVGTAGALAALSAGFAALVALVALGGSALLLTGRPATVGGPTGEAPSAARGRRRGRAGAAQAGALGAALLFATVTYAVWRIGFSTSAYPGGAFGAAAVGRLLFGHDALAAVAVAAMLMIGLGGGVRAIGRDR